MVIWHLKQIGNMKKLDKSLPHELTGNWKSQPSEVLSSLILPNEPFLDWIVMCDKKWTVYNNQWRPAQWLDQEAAPKHLPKPKVHQKKVVVTVWWSAAQLIHYSFLNPGETITSETYAQEINKMHWKLQHLQATLVNRKGPILLHNTTNHIWHNQHFKSWMTSATSAILTWPLANQLPLLQESQQLPSMKMHPQPAGGKKCFPRISWILKHGFLRYSSVQSLSCVWLFVTTWTAARQVSLSITSSQSLPKLMSIESVMPSNHLIFCRPVLLLPSIFPSIRVFSNESILRIMWPKYWSFSFNISPSSEHPRLISFRMNWLDLLAVQGTLKSLLQHHFF